MSITETETPPCACPCCGDLQDRATDLTGQRRPKPGDLSICLVCGFVSAFTEQMERRELTPEEFAVIPGDVLAEISLIERARVATMAGSGRRPRP